MLEQETDQLVTFVEQRTIGAQPSISVRELLAAPVPYALKAFFRADVEAMLLEEQVRSWKTSRFNHRHPEVENLQAQINSVLVMNFAYTREEFLQRLPDATNLIVNYLLRPQWTLRGVMFEKSDRVSSPALLQLFRYFGPYEYLRDICGRYIHDRQVAGFTKQEFAEFLWSADAEYVRRKTGDELAKVMSPLYELLDFPRSGEGKALPVKALMKYFEDKGLAAVHARLEGEAAQGKTGFLRSELGQLLEDVRRTSGAFEIHMPDLDARPFVPSASGAEPTPPAQSSHRKLAGAFDDDERRRFVKRIFLNDESAFEHSLDSLSTLAEWKDASTYIDEIFIRNSIDPYSSDAERFVKVIFEQFHPTGEPGSDR